MARRPLRPNSMIILLQCLALHVYAVDPPLIFLHLQSTLRHIVHLLVPDTRHKIQLFAVGIQKLSLDMSYNGFYCVVASLERRKRVILVFLRDLSFFDLFFRLSFVSLVNSRPFANRFRHLALQQARDCNGLDLLLHIHFGLLLVPLVLQKI